MAHLSARSVICTAHLLRAQNPKAILQGKDEQRYYQLVAEWCEAFAVDGVHVYWSPEGGDAPLH